jgi:urease accessory protein
MLADGRFPVGGHAHSAGVESAIADGRVADLEGLAAFVDGRLHTVALVEAALAVAALERLSERSVGEAPEVLLDIDAEAEARIPAPPLREASRRLGRQLARVARRCWDHPVLDVLGATLPLGAHQPVALGAAAVAGGLGADEVAQVSVYGSLTTPTQAAVRLLGLDPFAVAELVASRFSGANAVAAEAVAAAGRPLAELPAGSGMLLDIAAMEHRDRPIRMFAT